MALPEHSGYSVEDIELAGAGRYLSGARCI
jgi:hypothetical protein